MGDPRQAVLLAAGAGSRLLPMTRDMPKCLVPLRGVPLLEHLLLGLAPLNLEELVVVTGWQRERFTAHLGEQRGHTRIRYVHNAAFRETNNIVSLQLAAPWVRPPFVLLESDLYLERAAVTRLRVPDNMLVAPYVEGMRGTGVAIDSSGRVARLFLQAHTLAAEQRNLLWKTVNACTLSAPAWDQLQPALAARIARGYVGDYYEAALVELLAARKMCLNAVDVSSTRWFEIDDESDLARAESLIGPHRLSLDAGKPSERVVVNR